MHTIEVACAIILHDYKVLVAQRGGSKSLPYKWEFPGGKVDPGETEEDCLIRELKEELDISINVIAKLTSNAHDYGSFAINLNAFIAKIAGGEFRLQEHNDIRWFRKEELLSLDWAEADVPIVEHLLTSKYL